jgi:hypothetical protein
VRTLFVKSQSLGLKVTMAISEKDIKKLWGLAAGRCAKPGCEEECIKFLAADNPTIIGEMAHVIAKKPNGPRGSKVCGEDTYENIVLLCPTHHTEIDKAPEGTFSIEQIHEWKRAHEDRVRSSFLSPRFGDRRQMAEAMKRLMIKKKTAWKQYGPESDEAIRNPLSNLNAIWELRKLDTLVPNNRCLIQIIEQNERLFGIDDFATTRQFIEHAEGFERNCHVRTEGVPRFPINFDELVDRYVATK